MARNNANPKKLSRSQVFLLCGLWIGAMNAVNIVRAPPTGFFTGTFAIVMGVASIVCILLSVLLRNREEK